MNHITNINNISSGQSICAFYRDDEKYNIITGTIKSLLNTNSEIIIYENDKSFSDHFKNNLSRENINSDELINKNFLRLKHIPDFKSQENFSSEDIQEFFHQELSGINRDNNSNAYFILNMEFSRTIFTDSKSIADCASFFTKLCHEYSISGIFMYDRNLFESEHLIQILSRYARIINENEVVENIYYIGINAIHKENDFDSVLDILINKIQKVGKQHQNVSPILSGAQILLNTTKEGALLVDPNGVILTANKSFTNNANLKLKELIGKKAHEIFKTEFAQRQKELVEKSINTAQAILSEDKFGEKYFEFRIYPVTGISGKIEHVALFYRDITDQRILYNHLKESEENYRSLIERANDGITIVSDEKFIFANEKFANILGYRTDEIINKHFFSVIAQESHEDVFKNYSNRMLGRPSPPIYEIVAVKKSGEKIDVELNAGVIKYKDKPADLVLVRDITDRKKMERDLRKRESMFKAITENTTDITMIFDDEAKYRYVTPNVKEIFGFSQEEVIGKYLTEFVHPDDVNIAFEFLNRSLQSKNFTVKLDKVRALTKNGGYIFVEALITNMFEYYGVDGVVVNCRDITEKIRIEDDIKAYARKLEILNKAISFANKTFNVGELINKVLESLLESFEFDAAGFYRYNDYDETADLMFGKNIPQDFQEAAKTLDATVYPYSETFKKHNPVFLEHYNKILKDDHKLNGFLCATIIPVMAKNRIIGSINFGSKTRSTFEEEEKNILISIGREIGTAFDKLFIEEELLKSRQNLMVTLNSIGDAVITTDTNGFITLMNPIAEKMCGYTANEAYGRPVKEVFNIVNSVTGKPADNPIGRVLKEGIIIGLANHTELISRNGTSYQISDSAAPIKKPDGEIIGVIMVFQDVSEKYRVERELVNSETKLRAIFDNANEAIFVVDNNNRYIDVNTAATKIFGYSREEFIESGTKLPHMNISKTERNNLKSQIWKSGGSLFDVKLIKKDGNFVWCDINVSPFTLDGMDLILTVMRDNSERKDIENKLDISEMRYKHLLESISDIVFVLNKDLKFVVVNKAFEQFIGIPASKVLENKFTDIYPDIDMGKLLRELENVMESRKPASIVRKYSKMDNIVLWFETFIYPIPEGILCITVDITERMKMQQELVERENRLRTIVQNMSIMLIAFDFNGSTIVWNKECERLTGYNEDEIIGNVDNIFLPYPDKIYVKELITSLKENDKDYRNFEMKITCRDNSKKVISWNRISGKYPIPGWHSWIVGTDITELRNTEIKLIEALEKAQKSDQLKSAFLANMSHEIRTPLNGIFGFVDLMLYDKKLSQNYKENLNIIKDNGNLLLSIINDILDLSKIEANQITIEKIPCAIRSIFKILDSRINALIIKKEKELDLIREFDDKISPIIECDPNRLQQILNNLLSNAVKFTHKGYVKYGVIQKDSNTLEFYVKDTGIGIPEDKREDIFSPFHQINSSLSQAFGGTGLGLTITKRLVEIMGGKIWLSSVPGRGSVFSFTLPYFPVYDKEFDKEQIKTNISSSFKSKTILIVEDNQLNRVIVKKMLTEFGYKTIIAHDGQEAINTYKSRSDIDLILMDIRMPNMDGITATKTIRYLENSSDKKKIPIIALTAAAMAEDIEKGMEAGCDSYITKPFETKKLMKTIDDFLS